MEETFIVLMLKNNKTGFLETELGSYGVERYEEYIYSIYAQEEADGIYVYIKLSVERDLADWEFDAVLDYYDLSIYENITLFALEEEESYNPVWLLKIPFSEREDIMEEKFNEILRLHVNELEDVYASIKDLEGDYS